MLHRDFEDIWTLCRATIEGDDRAADVRISEEHLRGEGTCVVWVNWAEKGKKMDEKVALGRVQGDALP